MKKKILNILGIIAIVLFAFFIITLKTHCLESHQNAYIITGNSEHQLKYFVNIDHELVPKNSVLIYIFSGIMVTVNFLMNVIRKLMLYEWD